MLELASSAPPETAPQLLLAAVHAVVRSGVEHPLVRDYQAARSRALGALRETLRSIGRERPVYWLSGDPGAGLEEPTYRLVRFDGDDVAERRLARFESYGEWIEWLEG